MENKYNEILKLKSLLEQDNIEFEFEDCFDGYYLKINDNCDVIEHKGSRGSKDDLLEIMIFQNAEGFLNAKECYNLIKNYLNNDYIANNPPTIEDLRLNKFEELKAFFDRLTKQKVGEPIDLQLNDFLSLYGEKTDKEENFYCIELLMGDKENGFSDILEDNDLNLYFNGSNSIHIIEQILNILYLTKNEIIEKYFNEEEESENNKEKFIKVVIKEPNKNPEVKTIQNNYETTKSIVGGYIEHCYSDIISEGITIIINEEGKLIDLPLNFRIKDYADYIVGNAIFVKFDEEIGENVSLNDEEINKILQWIEEQSKPNTNAFTKWLDRFLLEKGFNTKEYITLIGEKEDEVFGSITKQIQFENVIDWIKNTNKQTQDIIKNQIVQIDFTNGSIEKYFIWIARKIYLNE